MTLKEYGPMQDNILVTQLIENLLGKHIDSAFPEAHYVQREIDDFKKYFAMVNDTLDTIADYYTKLGAKNPFPLPLLLHGAALPSHSQIKQCR